MPTATEDGLPEGLSGGHLRFNPESLLLFSNEDSDKFPLFTTAGWQDRARQFEFPLRARYFHERDHLLRYLSTSFGMVCYAIYGQLLYETASILANSVVPQSQNFMPLLGASKDAFLLQIITGGKDLNGIIQYVNTSGKGNGRRLRYVILRELLNVLEGRQAYFWNDRLALLGLPILTAELTDTFGKPDWPGSEMVGLKVDDPLPSNPRIEDFRLGTEEILEICGYHMEKVYALAWDEEINESTDIGQDRTYTNALRFFLTEMADYLPRVETPIEFHAALNLALWTPITPRGPWLKKNYFSWRDITPGWRFVTATLALKKLGIRPRYHDELNTMEQCDEAVREVQQLLCQHLGWPTPKEIAEVWLSVINSTLAGDTARTSLLYLGKGHPRLKWASTLLPRAASMPFSLYYRTHEALADGNPVMFPGAVFRDRDVILHNDDYLLEDLPCNFREYYLLYGGRFLMEGTETLRRTWKHHNLAAIGQIGVCMKSFCSNPTLLLENLERMKLSLEADKSAFHAVRV